VKFVAEERLFMLPSQRFQYAISVDDSVVDESADSNSNGSSNPTNTQSTNASYGKALSSQPIEQGW
jgi:hypothetical protein